MLNSPFNKDSTVSDVIQGIRLDGKTALVTGASGGIGEVTANTLAEAGAEVILASRDIGKTSRVVEKIRTATGNKNIHGEQLDLADEGAVRAFAKRINANHPKLHLLINNAGVMACPLRRTATGHEMQFGVNHLGHFLLTVLLKPILFAAAPGRIVNLSSAAHLMSDIDLKDPDFNHREYDKWISYGQSKTANILFSVDWTRRFASDGVTANAVHPGRIPTDLGRHLSDEDMKAITKRAGGEYKSLEAGAATTVWAATSELLEGKSGLYLEDCGFSQLHDEANPTIGGYKTYALNTDSAEQLWELSEHMLGVS